jgi:hypothetical protein
LGDAEAPGFVPRSPTARSRNAASSLVSGADMSPYILEDVLTWMEIRGKQTVEKMPAE